MNTYVDSHAHLGDEAFAQDREAMLQRARDVGLSAIINICTDPETLEIGLRLHERHPWIHLVAATTPHDVGEEDPFFVFVEELAAAGVLVAIGETGLDYHYERAPREFQKKWLRRYLELASTHGKPVVIHCRDAFADLFAILDEYPAVKGVLHCFTGTLEEAKAVVNRGWYLSLSGIVTFKKSETLRNVARSIPLDQLLIETDAPYLAPTPYRGKRNEPTYVVHVAECIANARGVPLEAVAEATTHNAHQLFSLSGLIS